MDGGRLNQLEVCGKEDGESKHSVGEEEEEEGGEQDNQLDQQAGRHVCTYNRPGVAGAVLQTPSSLIHWFID